MIIAIDGPAASGKSTTAKLVAERLGFTYLDTGAMYRAVTLGLTRANQELDDQESLKKTLDELNLELKIKAGELKINLNGEDVTELIRTSSVTEKVSSVSAVPLVRKALVPIQRKLASKADYVVEGRDIGTVVFPDAAFKFFIFADYETRAARRRKDLEEIGENKKLEEIIEDLKERDQKDSSRDHSPLKKAQDAMEVNTTSLTIEEQVELIVKEVNKSINQQGKPDKMELTKQPEPVVEQTSVEISAAASADTLNEEAPAISTTEVTTDTVVEELNYLDPQLFKDVRRVTPAELNDFEEKDEMREEEKEKYISTFSDIHQHTIITGRVIGLNEKEILIDIGFKSEGVINRDEFEADKLPAIGDKLDIYLEYIEDESGRTVLSKEKADFLRRWQDLKEVFENETTITGRIIRRIKGGMIVELGVVQAFLPGSQIDVRPIKDFDQFIDQDMELRIVKFNEFRKNIVVSHKAILMESLEEQRESLFNDLEVGKIVEGTVKNITDFGVFIDLGGVDGLLHITDLSWGRVNHPSEVVSLDDTLMVKIIDFDQDKKRISLGLKQLTPHPWEEVNTKYPEGTQIKGRVVSLTNYGAFVELEPGVEGLIHISEMSWTRHVKNPSEIYTMGEEVEAVVLSLNSEERKISLGAKQLQADPWDEIEEKYTVGSTVKGKVINLTQFGAFVEIEEGIDGLIHVSDLSWTKIVRHPREVIEKGAEVQVRILDVSRESRRIALGLKQEMDDPWPAIISHFETGSEVEGEIIRVLDKGVIIQLEMDVEGIVPFGKQAKRLRKAMSAKLKPGEKITGVVMEVKADEKKVILYSEEFSGSGPGVKDDVQEYLKNQNAPAVEKIEIPSDS